MVESTDSRERDHAAVFDGLHVATMRRSLVQRLVNPVFVIIDDVRAENPSKMLFTKHDHVVETVAAAGPNDPLDVWILPGAARRADDFFDTHHLHSSDELLAVHSIAIAEQVTRSFVPRKRFGDLTSRPSCGRVCSDGEVNDVTTFVPQYDKAVEELKRYCRYQ